jgi:hypothetical protein
MGSIDMDNPPWLKRCNAVGIARWPMQPLDGVRRSYSQGHFSFDSTRQGSMRRLEAFHWAWNPEGSTRISPSHRRERTDP